MSPKLILRNMRRWPRWTIIPLSLALAGIAIVLGLILEPAGYALSPNIVTPEPTMPTITYSQDASGTCHDCHFSLEALKESASDPDTAADFLIDRESIDTPHGRLGCLACHSGDGAAADKDGAHQNLIPDMSAEDPQECVICHQDLPDEIPTDRLRVPHGDVVRHAEAMEPCGVHCSDCHGGVGHGFDPVSGRIICPMTVCVQCHEDRNLEIQLANCDGCHIGIHDVAASLTCNDCHMSTEVWTSVHLGVHPMELSGKHGELDCFECHRYPNFKGLNNVCTDCHVSGHTDWGDHDCSSCHDPGATWDMVALTWDDHVDHWDQYKGEHLNVSCRGCHFAGYTDLDPECDTCHTTPGSHDDGRRDLACTNCHQADRPWGE